jgi:hypothetical protein
VTIPRATNPTITLNHRVNTRIKIVAALARSTGIPSRKVISATEVISYVPTPPGRNDNAPMIDAVECTNVACNKRMSEAGAREGNPAPVSKLSNSHSSRHSMNQPGILTLVLKTSGFGPRVLVMVCSISSKLS